MKLGNGEKTVFTLAGLVVLVAGMKLASPLFVPFVAAVFITVISVPIARWLERRGLPRWLANLTAVTLDGIVLVGFIGLVGGSMNEFYERVPDYQARLAELALTSADCSAGGGSRISEVARMTVCDSTNSSALTFNAGL